HRDKRNTALISEPSTSARTHPYVFLSGLVKCEIFMATRATTNETRSLSMWNESATREFDLDMLPITSSTRKNDKFSVIIVAKAPTRPTFRLIPSFLFYCDMSRIQ
ncbi:hypothetical protein BpHYR1_024027, partial [Brachionus plicatilis]